MSSQRNQDGSEQQPGFYFLGGRRNTTTVTETGYQVFVSVTFGLWVVILLVVIVWAKFSVDIDQQDIATTAGLASGLSALALAILAFIHQVNAGERYLKLSLAVLSFLFVSSALLAIIELILYGAESRFHPTVTLYVVFALVLVLGIFTIGKRLRISLYVFSPFLTPLLFVVRISQDALPTSAVLLLVLATTGLAVLSVVFVVYMHRAKNEQSTEEEFIRIATERWKGDINRFIRTGELKEIILEKLRRRRQEQFAAGGADKADNEFFKSELLMDEEDLLYELKRSKIIEEDSSLISEALSELKKDAKRVYSITDRKTYRHWYYIAPALEEIIKAEEYIRSQNFIILKKCEDGDEIDFRPIIKPLCRQFRYPASVVKEYMMPPVSLILQHDFRSTGRIGSLSNSKVLYVRKVEEAQGFADRLIRRWNEAGLKRMTDKEAQQLIVESLSRPSIVGDDLKTTMSENSLTEWFIQSLKAVGENTE